MSPGRSRSTLPAKSNGTCDARPSQKDRALSDLRAAGFLGVCSEEWYSHGLPNARNRVGELVNVDHYHIASMPCDDDHGRTTYFRYVLIHGPERICAKCPWMPAQQTLAMEVA